MNYYGEQLRAAGKAAAAKAQAENQREFLMSLQRAEPLIEKQCPDCGARQAHELKCMRVQLRPGEIVEFLECSACAVGSPRAEWKITPQKGGGA